MHICWSLKLVSGYVGKVVVLGFWSCTFGIWLEKDFHVVNYQPSLQLCVCVVLSGVLVFDGIEQQLG